MKNYTVSFYKLKNYGGILEGDGTTIVSGYDEEFETESYEEAMIEFENRKKEVTSDNMLGVTISAWDDEKEIDQLNYSSKTILENEQLEKLMKKVEW